MEEQRTQDEDDRAQAEGGADAGGGSSAQEGEDENVRIDKEASEEMEKLEEDPPEKLEDWPKGPAMYKTFGGPEGDHSYDEGPEAQLGPSSLRHHEGGDVSIEGEKVDDPEEYKGDPIPGGPTDRGGEARDDAEDEEETES